MEEDQTANKNIGFFNLIVEHMRLKMETPLINKYNSEDPEIKKVVAKEEEEMDMFLKNIKSSFPLIIGNDDCERYKDIHLLSRKYRKATNQTNHSKSKKSYKDDHTPIYTRRIFNVPIDVSNIRSSGGDIIARLQVIRSLSPNVDFTGMSIDDLQYYENTVMRSSHR